MGNGQGLKEQWGVKDPAKAGSDKQSQEFQASFQREMAAINGHLQYTSANADAPHHNPLEARRDALYPAFQSALAQIDRTNPAKAKGAIDKVLGDGKALCAETAALHKSAEKALNDWKARQAKYDAAVHQVEELEAWGDTKAPPLRSLVDGVRTQTNQRTYAQACLIVDQLLPKLKPIYDDYLKQKAAKPKYEQALAEQSARLDALKAAERPSQPMTAKAGEADAALLQAHGGADVKNFVSALEKMHVVKTHVDALDKLTKDPQRAKFLADRKAAEDALNAAKDTTFKTLEPDWTAMTQLRDQSDPAADSGDYAGANKMLADLKVKLEAYKKKLEVLKKQKQAYDDAHAPLQPRLTAAAQSKYAKLAPIQQDITAVQGQMEAAAQSEDFVQALKLAKDLGPKLDAYEKELAQLEQQRKEYEDALAALQPQLQEALKSTYTPLKPKVDEITKVKGEMEAAAQKQDYEAAMTSLNDLKAKVDAFLPDLKKLQQAEADYTKTWAALKPKIDDALLSSKDFAALSADRSAIETAESNVVAAATAQDFEKALQLANDLGPKVDAYLTKAKTKQDDIQKKADDITKKLDDANVFTRDKVAKDAANGLSDDELKALPAPVRNRLLEQLNKSPVSDEDKAAMKKLFSVKSLDPEFEKIDDANQKKMIEKMKTDPAFKNARDNWGSLNEKQRLEVLKKAVDYEADAYGIPKTDVEAYSPKKDDGTPDSNLYGEYDHSKGKLMISREMMQNIGFDQALDTAVHENGHRYQATLVDQLEAGKIKPGDPLYNQAMMFKLNDTSRGFYVQPPGATPSPDTGNEYFTQPQENQSRRTGTAVTNAGIGK
jgi:hypothetical protein